MDFLLSRKLLWALVAFGALVRIVVYAANRSLWFDEAALGLNLLERSFRHLLSPLDFGQGAPVGFLMVERLAGESLGYSEYALRLFPLVCGLAALVAFVPLARRVLTPFAAPLAVALFAVSQGPVYYSSELKPYAVDVAATVFLLLGGVILTERLQDTRIVVGIGVGGVAVMAFSFASIFVLAAVAIVLAVEAARRRGRLSRAHMLVLAVWITGAVGAAFFALEHLSTTRSAFQAGSDAIGQDSVFKLHSLNVFASNLAASVGLAQEPPWNQLQKVAALVAIVGAGSLLLQVPARGLMVLLPIPVTLVAAALGQYPLTYRTTLFLVPIVVLALAEGIAQASSRTPSRWRATFAAALTVAIAAGPVSWSAKAVLHPPGHEEIKPVLTYIREHWRSGDALYLHYEAQYPFLYYAECGCFSNTGPDGTKLWPVAPNPGRRIMYAPAVRPKSRAVLVGPIEGPQALQIRDLDSLRGRARVWFVYTHLHDAEGDFIRRRLLGRLDEMGVRTAVVDEPGAHAYLYTLKASRSR